MSSIASLLFGDDGDALLDLIAGGIAGRDGDRQAAERVRRSGEWCGGTPDRVSARDGRGAAWPRGGRRGSPRPTI